ncbi:hypothetical protein BS47DRAFT_1311820 [Hydnum rufescens UP504]|uniref:Uncharacterized protein n=1 Tax=Hydnum rufescens UP504 TaxID=1448309 RepID=A0A9P6BA90_9AGAM|nr:hypothetical protein BS47DRAFT_1311820 [Hydnum rufescens UP504]
MPPVIPIPRIAPSTRRSFISSLFVLTFFGTVLTVSASSVLPCPAHSTMHHNLDDGGHSANNRISVHPSSNANAAGSGVVTVPRRPRRWIEEKIPGR